MGKRSRAFQGQVACLTAVGPGVLGGMQPSPATALPVGLTLMELMWPLGAN
jgi:hypothetical protein